MQKISLTLSILALLTLSSATFAENEGGTGDSVRVEQRSPSAVNDLLRAVSQWFHALTRLDAVTEQGTGGTTNEGGQGTGANDGGSIGGPREASGGSGKPGAGNGTGLDFGAGNGTGAS